MLSGAFQQRYKFLGNFIAHVVRTGAHQNPIFREKSEKLTNTFDDHFRFTGSRETDQQVWQWIRRTRNDMLHCCNLIDVALDFRIEKLESIGAKKTGNFLFILAQSSSAEQISQNTYCGRVSSSFSIWWNSDGNRRLTMFKCLASSNALRSIWNTKRFTSKWIE